MPGLLSKARRIRDADSSVASRAEATFDVDESGISADKRRELRAQIERIVAQERRPVPGSAFDLRATRQGVLIPVVVNAALALLTVAVILIASRFFAVDRKSVV